MKGRLIARRPVSAARLLAWGAPVRNQARRGAPLPEALRVNGSHGNADARADGPAPVPMADVALRDDAG